jgi:hypothetical protein
MLPETLERLHVLMEQGATVVANAPQCIATWAGGDEAQARFDKNVEAIWGKAESGSITTIGKGRLLSGVAIEEAIGLLGLKPDVRGDVRWIHRQVEGADWYFVTPPKQQAFKGMVSFRAEGAAELWNPVTGEITPLNVDRQGEYASIELDMPKAGSCFVVFNHHKQQQQVEKVELANTQPVSNKWTVQFPEGWGTPAELEMETLAPWREWPMSKEGQAFSGTATYTTTFNWANDSKEVILDLGKVNMIAEVLVNGQKVRTLWCAPYAADITAFVKPGENKLCVKVTSTWFNRLAYDASLPVAERRTWTIEGPQADAPRKDYGLMGPVTLKTE